MAITGVTVGSVDVDFTSFTAKEFLAPDAYVTDNNIGEGDDLFSVGLFSPIAGGRNEPIVRFGKIASGRRHPVNILSDPGFNSGTIAVDAYLIEMASWGGCSGAPVFVAFDPTRRVKVPMPAMTPLLGVIHGHYDIPARVRFVGDPDYDVEDTVEARRVVGVNSGIAIVIPAAAVLELLAHEQVVEWCRRVGGKAKAEHSKPDTPS